jgi:hypothetical protein
MDKYFVAGPAAAEHVGVSVKKRVPVGNLDE